MWPQRFRSTESHRTSRIQFILSQSLPADVYSTIQALLATGRYASEEDVLRRALQSLQQRDEDLEAILAGIADLSAGRTRSLDEFDQEFRIRNGIHDPA